MAQEKGISKHIKKWKAMKKTVFNLDIEKHTEGDKDIVEMTIDGIIGEDPFSFDDEDSNTKQMMREQLREVDSIDADKIIVNISSLGGDVDHGLAIHDLLAANSAEIETHIIGMTASAATIIAQAGDERFMSDNALYLVHRAWTIGMGNANDFGVLASDLKTIDDRISNIYAKRSDKNQSDFLDLMNEANGDGKWISAEEAKGFGLIDTISEPMKVAAMDREVFEKYNIPKLPQMKEQKTSTSISGQEIVESMKEDEFFIETSNQEKQEDESSVSAMSRERAKIEILKLKYKNHG